MMPRCRFLAALPALALLLPLPGGRAQVPADVAARIVEEGLEHSHVMQFQDFLCNHIGARLTGSDSFTRACEWARGEFAAMGLDARLEEWGEWNLVWNRGQWSGRVVEPAWQREGWGNPAVPLQLEIATPAWTAPTKGRVKGAMVAMPTTQEELDAIAGRLAEVYVYGTEPRQRSEFRDALREAFAATPPLGFVRSARSGGIDRRYQDQIRVFGNNNVARGSWDRRPTVPEIYVRGDQAELLEEMLDAGREVVVEFDIRNRFREGPITLHNVLAEIPGTEKPDEYVIVCGHLDSWHQATGATDNGTGTCTTLEAARILAAVGAKPKRTIRFLLWGGEEQGLLGSAEYVKRHRAEMSRVSAVFNHDTGTNWAQSLTVTDGMYEMFQEVLAPVMALQPPAADADKPVFELTRRATIGGGGGGSDHASFLSAGVPAWSWGLTGSAEYGYGWHSQWDTYDIVLPDYQRHTATVIALTALGVANLPDLLPREGIERRGGGSRSLTGLITERFGLEFEEDGLVVAKVVAKGPAERAGLQKGDVLTALWGEETAETRDIYFAWRGNRDAEQIEFTFRRGDTVMNAKTPAEVAAEKPAEAAAEKGAGVEKEPAPEAEPKKVDAKGGAGSQPRGEGAGAESEKEPSSRRTAPVLR